MQLSPPFSRVIEKGRVVVSSTGFQAVLCPRECKLHISPGNHWSKVCRTFFTVDVTWAMCTPCLRSVWSSSSVSAHVLVKVEWRLRFSNFNFDNVSNALSITNFLEGPFFDTLLNIAGVTPSRVSARLVRSRLDFFLRFLSATAFVSNLATLACDSSDTTGAAPADFRFVPLMVREAVLWVDTQLKGVEWWLLLAPTEPLWSVVWREPQGTPLGYVAWTVAVLFSTTSILKDTGGGGVGVTPLLSSGMLAQYSWSPLLAGMLTCIRGLPPSCWVPATTISLITHSSWTCHWGCQTAWKMERVRGKRWTGRGGKRARDTHNSFHVCVC